MNVSLSEEATKQSIESIKRYFKEELEHEIGDLKASLVLEFILPAQCFSMEAEGRGTVI